MKIKHIWIIVWILLSTNIFAQVGQNPPPNKCNDIIRTTTPTINTWDWRTPTWEVYVAGYFNPPVNVVTSPFYEVNNFNTYGLAQFETKDYDPNEGWELIKRDIGTPQIRTSTPYWVFYNKNTAILRVFFLIAKSSPTQTIDVNGGGTVGIEFRDRDLPAYQSNLLTAQATPLLPSDQFKNKTNLKVVNKVVDADLQWMYADFPMVYDPCTCLYSGSLNITASIYNTAQIDMTINSQPYSSPANNNQAGGDLKSAFSTIGSFVEGGVKALVSVQEATQDLNKRWQSAGLPSPNIDISNFEKFLSGAKKLADVIPGVSGVANKVFAALDFFTGKSKKDGSNGSTGTVILNNFKANGTITSSGPKSDVTFRIPGSNPNGASQEVLPVYDNPLGIFNLLTTPEVKVSVFNFYQPIYIYNAIMPCFQTEPPRDIVMPESKTLKYELLRDLEFVLNPALNINYQLSDVQTAFIFEDSNIPTSIIGTQWTNTTKEILTKKTDGFIYDIYRSHYYPISCLKEAKPFIRLARFIDPRTGLYCNYLKEPTVYIKIVARLVKNNSGDPRDEILFVAKYPVKLIRENAQNANIPPSLENIPEVLTIPDGQVYNQTTTIQALNLVSIGRVTLNNGARLIVRAGQIQVRETATITPQYDLRTVSLYPSNCNIKQPPATAARIDQFCRSNLYTNPARFAVSREIRDIEEIRKEEEAINLSASPNPTKSDVTISYILEQDAKVSVYVSNIIGDRVYTLIDKEQAKGLQEVTFSTHALPAGIYLYTLETEHHKITKRLVVVK